MKKTLLIAALLTLAVLAIGATGIAYAHSPYPGTPDGAPAPYGPMGGYGMMGGYDMMGGYGMYGMYGEEGPMHDAMIAAVAEALDLSPEEIEARHDAGETIWDIAAAQGLSDDDIRELMFTAHDSALEQAVAEGWLTAEQAEWMDSHMESMWNGEYGNHCGSSGWDSMDMTW